MKKLGFFALSSLSIVLPFAACSSSNGPIAGGSGGANPNALASGTPLYQHPGHYVATVTLLDEGVPSARFSLDQILGQYETLYADALRPGAPGTSDPARSSSLRPALGR